MVGGTSGSATPNPAPVLLAACRIASALQRRPDLIRGLAQVRPTDHKTLRNAEQPMGEPVTGGEQGGHLRKCHDGRLIDRVRLPLVLHNRRSSSKNVLDPVTARSVGKGDREALVAPDSMNRRPVGLSACATDVLDDGRVGLTRPCCLEREALGGPTHPPHHVDYGRGSSPHAHHVDDPDSSDDHDETDDYSREKSSHNVRPFTVIVLSTASRLSLTPVRLPLIGPMILGPRQARQGPASRSCASTPDRGRSCPPN